MASVSVETYDMGDVIRLEATYTVAGTLTNPTTLVVKVEDPLGVGTDVSAQVTTPSVGVKRLDFDLSTAISGEWWARFTSTGAAAATEEHRFYVRERQVA